MLQFNFKKSHIAGSINTAADSLSRLELKVTEKIHLKIREDVQTTPIEVSTSSSDVADEEHFFFTQADNQDETEEQILHWKGQSRQKKTAEWVINQEPSLMKPSIKEFTKIDGNTTSYFINGIKASARLRVEQDADLILKNLKLKKLGQPLDNVLLSTDRFKHDKANEDRIILKDELLFRKYYEETCSVKYYQILIPKQLVNEVLRNLHGDFGKHSGITKTIIAYRENYHFTNYGSTNQAVGYVMWAMS